MASGIFACTRLRHAAGCDRHTSVIRSQPPPGRVSSRRRVSPWPMATPSPSTQTRESRAKSDRPSGGSHVVREQRRGKFEDTTAVRLEESLSVHFDVTRGHGPGIHGHAVDVVPALGVHANRQGIGTLGARRVLRQGLQLEGVYQERWIDQGELLEDASIRDRSPGCRDYAREHESDWRSLSAAGVGSPVAVAVVGRGRASVAPAAR